MRVAPIPTLQQRRERLLVRSAELRRELSRQSAVFATPLRWADRGLAAADWLRRHPEWPLGAAVLVIVLRPRRALRWLVRAVGLWRGARWLVDAAASRPGVPSA